MRSSGPDFPRASSVSAKDDLRRVMRQKRREVPPERRAAVSHDICTRLLARDDVQSAIRNREVIAVYIATPREIDLAEFIASVHAQGGRLAAPRWNGTEYEMAEFIPEQLHLNPSSQTPKIPEPPQPIPYSLLPIPSLYLVPGLAFTREGDRLGEGGGWYDRMLSSVVQVSSPSPREENSSLQLQLPTTTTLLGLAYSFQLLPALPREPHDCRLTDIVVGF